MEVCCSDLIWASQGLAAASVLATIELRLLLVEAGDRMVALSIYSRLTFYVDDDTIETVCVASCVVAEHAKAVNALTSDLQSLGLQFSDTKNVTCASTNKLAKASVRTLEGIRVKTSSRVTSSGTGLGAGTRRNTTQIVKRWRAFCHRRARFKRLRAAGVETDRLLRTGGISALVFGRGL